MNDKKKKTRSEGADSRTRRYRYSEAPIWELQRAYYEQLGLQAWNNDKVPQFITSNPMIATAYAEILFGFLQDRAASGNRSETVTILELGAGAGRLACHVLHKLAELRDYAGIELPPYRYVMTDLVAKNVEGWLAHPALRPFAEEGVLDFARFDAVGDSTVKLERSGETLEPGSLRQPLVIVANYFFDGIPQELLYIGDGRVFECDVLVEEPANAASMAPADVLKSLKLRYEHRPAPEYESESHPYRQILDTYRKELEDSHILFPSAGLACLERLEKLSDAGFVLLTADKGDHLLDNWRFAEPPKLVLHGSFSLTTNYHAFQMAYESRGALVEFPVQHYKSINIGCFWMLDKPKEAINSRLAYRRFVDRFGPDDFFSLKQWADRGVETMDLAAILSFWRLGGYDAEFFAHSSKRISSLLAEANDEEIADLQQGIRRMWSSYYRLEQNYDLALEAGLLLFEMDRYADAKEFLERSVADWTSEEAGDSMILYCLAICHCELGDESAAAGLLREALVLEPDHEEAASLLELLEARMEG